MQKKITSFFMMQKKITSFFHDAKKKITLFFRDADWYEVNDAKKDYVVMSVF